MRSGRHERKQKADRSTASEEGKNYTLHSGRSKCPLDRIRWDPTTTMGSSLMMGEQRGDQVFALQEEHLDLHQWHNLSCSQTPHRSSDGLRNRLAEQFKPFRELFAKHKIMEGKPKLRICSAAISSAIGNDDWQGCPTSKPTRQKWWPRRGAPLTGAAAEYDGGMRDGDGRR